MYMGCEEGMAGVWRGLREDGMGGGGGWQVGRGGRQCEDTSMYKV